MNAPRVRRLAGIAKIFFVVPVLGQISLRVKTPDRNAADGSELGITALIQIDATGRANRFLRRFFQGFGQRGLSPAFF